MTAKSKVRAWARNCFKLATLLLFVVHLTGCADLSPTDTEAAKLESSPLPTSTTSNPTASPTRPVASPSATATPRPTVTPSPTALPASSSPLTTPPPTDTALPRNTPTATSTATPEPTPTDGGASRVVPILMYHYLSKPPADADAIRRDLSVTPANFEAQLAYLRQAGYETISLETLAYALSQDAPLPEKPIILTFDDGHRDNYENAFPLLRKYGYTATFFVFTQVIDTYNVDFLTWEMVIEMDQAGMEFGSHSYRHLDMSNRDVDFLVYEILGSKQAIEDRIGEPVHFFAYPSGAYDALTIEVLDSANFWGAMTTKWGSTHTYANRFEMPRIRMQGNDRVKDLANKLP